MQSTFVSGERYCGVKEKMGKTDGIGSFLWEGDGIFMATAVAFSGDGFGHC
jgi:hypothetical protein